MCGARDVAGPDAPAGLRLRMVDMAHRSDPTPRSCDFLDLAAGRGDSADGSAAGFLVWLVDDRDTVVVRAASTLVGAAQAARAYCAAWGAQVRYVEDPQGGIVDPQVWGPLFAAAGPLPYVYTVELRAPASTGRAELVSALWTSTDPAEALRWRSLLPEPLRGRTLVVSNAPDGHYPPRPRASEGEAEVPAV